MPHIPEPAGNSPRQGPGEEPGEEPRKEPREEPADDADRQADRYQRVRKLFDEAVDMEDMERRWFLQSVQDRDMAADVERLLESSACCGSFRDPACSRFDPQSSASDRRPDFAIDPTGTSFHNARGENSAPTSSHGPIPPQMTATETTADLARYCSETAAAARVASRQLASLDTDVKNRWLVESADALIAATADIISANQQDLDAAPAYGLSEAQIDRLKLDADRIGGIADGLRQVAALPDPVGEVLDGFTRPGGLKILKRRAPLGVVFFIYESRPNVTADAAAICVKSGNAVILRGGKEAIHSSRAIVKVLQRMAAETGIPESAVQLVATVDREAVGHFLKMDSLIDVTIPRGGEGLIRRVASEATMPVIKHYDGNCHVYLDDTADAEMAADVVENAKCQRMGVCNACESLLVHQSAVQSVLPVVATRLRARGIEMRADDRAAAVIKDALPATDADWGTEYLGPTISIKVVDSIDQAIEHINHFGSHHTDAILTGSLTAADQFTTQVDSSAVMVNASTRFNDGGVFGLGAEIGISTDKFHARGPCGLRELTTYKYIVQGNGHIRG